MNHYTFFPRGKPKGNSQWLAQACFIVVGGDAGPVLSQGPSTGINIALNLLPRAWHIRFVAKVNDLFKRLFI